MRKMHIFFILSLALCMTACSSIVNINFKVNSEPEGAQVMYKATGKELPCGDQWIYLGNTPLRGVHQFDKKTFKQTEKITMMVMHNGYVNQKREWAGDNFLDEAEKRGVIYWTPELVPNPGN